MPDAVDKSTVTSLIEWDRPPCISIMIPTERSGRETRQGPIRLRNLIQRAHEALVARGMRSPEADELLADVRGLLDRGSFWQHQDDGLAVFAAPGLTEAIRLAIPLEETLVVSDAFHIKPLLRIVDGSDRFNLLALSRNQVRLLWGRRHRIGEITVPDPIPKSLAEALWFEDREKQLQHHATDRSGQGRIVATFHGHGAPDENAETRDRAFLRAVDNGVLDLLDTSEPLVLAGVKELTALYHDLTEHPHVLDETITGNPDELTPEHLHERAWAIVEPSVGKQARHDHTAFIESAGRALEDLERVVSASLAGRVEALWAPLSQEIWGTAGDDGDLDVHDTPQPGDRDLLDLAAAAAWRRGGRAHIVDSPDDLPGDGPVAALLRY